MGGQPLIGSSARRVLKVHDGLLVGLSGLDGDVLTFSDELAASIRLLNLETAAASTRSSLGAGSRLPPRRLGAPSVSQLVSTKLYAQRTKSPYYVEPIIAGLVSVRGTTLTADEQRPPSQRKASSQPPPPPSFASSSSSSIAMNEGSNTLDLPQKSQTKMVPYLCSQDSLGAPMVATDFVCSGTCAPSLLGVCESAYRPNMHPEELWQVAGRCLLAAMERDCLSGVDAVVHLVTSSGITTHELLCSSD